MATKPKSLTKTVVDEARARLQLSIDSDNGNRGAALEAVKFSAGNGNQWPAAIKMQRQLDNRACMEFNKTDTFVRSVVNSMRQQRPRIKVHPVSDGADIQVAEVIEGLIRHIEVQSNADAAYDTAADYQVRMGWGFVRVVNRYVSEDSFDQELFIDRIRNPFSVYFDPTSVQPDGSDAMWAIIVAPMQKAEFEAKYPKKRVTDFKGAGDDLAGIPKEDQVMVAEYFRVEETPDTLCRLDDGRLMFKDQVPEGSNVVQERPSMRRVVKWSLLSGDHDGELEKRDWPGKHIPVIPTYGAELLEGDKLRRFGMVANLMDPQRAYNFWRTMESEIVALAPKAPWIVAEGQMEGHPEWDNANVKNYSTLPYKPVSDDSGNLLPPPQRTQPAGIPEGAVQLSQAASEDLKAIAGMFDPALGAPGNETSGDMVKRRQQQSDLSNFHFYDNHTRMIRWVGKILLDLAPHIYDAARVIRIIGEDGNPKSTQINTPQMDEMGAVKKVLNDLTVGRYDVVMDTGPGYDTKRQEGAENLLKFLSIDPEAMKSCADIALRMMDYPGAQEMADRLAMANPLAQIDKQIPEDMDPEARQMLAQAMGQVQMLKQQVQQLTQEKQAKVFGVQEREQAVTQREMALTHVREQAETHRLHVRELGEHERAELKAHTQRSDTESKNQTSLHETLIDATTDMALGHQAAMSKGNEGKEPKDSEKSSEMHPDVKAILGSMGELVKEMKRPKKRRIVKDPLTGQKHSVEE